jgi:hypothetical protein
MSDINIFAETDYRGQRKRFGIKREDRRLHMYVIGRTGMGKTTLLLNMLLNDIHAGEGVCFIDPHGDAVEALLDYIPESRVKDVIYFNPADTAYPIPLNPLAPVAPERRHLLVSGILSIFRKLYAEHWQHRQEHIMRNCLLTLLERDESHTLLDLYRLLADWRYRKKIVAEVKDPVVRAFWQGEFSKYVYQFKGEALAPIQNKLGAFLTTPLLRNIVGRPENRIDFREVMDTGKVLLVDLSKGRLGEDSAAFLSALLTVKLQLAAISRVDVPEERRRDFYLYIDEFQSFVATEGLDDILSEARKYRLCLTLAHQYMGQLDERLRQAIFGNVGTIITFPVGPENGERLEKEFGPDFRKQDLVEHPRHHVYLKLAIGGKTSRPFSAYTLPPFQGLQRQNNRSRLIRRSRIRYSPSASRVHRVDPASSRRKQQTLL